MITPNNIYNFNVIPNISNTYLFLLQFYLFPLIKTNSKSFYFKFVYNINLF